MGAEIGSLVSPTVLLVAAGLFLFVITGAAARIALFLEDVSQRPKSVPDPAAPGSTGCAGDLQRPFRTCFVP